MTTLTVADLRSAFSSLERLGYKPPPDLRPEDWLYAFGAISTDQFRVAMTEWLRGAGEGYWPKPGQILKFLPSRSSGTVPASLVAPDDRTDGWYVLRLAEDGPRVRYLPHAEARRRGLALPEAVSCPEADCQCDAIECYLPPADFGLSKRAATESPIHHALSHPQGWRWHHIAAAQRLQPVPVSR